MLAQPDHDSALSFQLLQKQLEKQRKKEAHTKAKLKLQAATTHYVAVKLRVMDPTVPLHWGGISAMPSVKPPQRIKLRLNVLQKHFDKYHKYTAVQKAKALKCYEICGQSATGCQQQQHLQCS